MPYRAAKWRDIERAGDVLADAFWHESVIGELIHPKRAAFPHDYRRYWRHKVTEWYWDCQHQLLAAYIARPGPNNRNEEVLVGVADWNRMGKRPVQYRERPGLRYLCKLSVCYSITRPSSEEIAVDNFNTDHIYIRQCHESGCAAPKSHFLLLSSQSCCRSCNVGHR